MNHQEQTTHPPQEADCGHAHAETAHADGCGHDHSHGGGHGHHHITVDDETSGSRLLLTLVLNLIIPIAQVIGGIMANSMALVSDAIHNFSDFTAVLISYIAYRIGKKGANLGNTFGYRRAEVLAALINVGILFGASLVIVYEAVIRFAHPEPVSGTIVMALAGVGIAGNGFSAWLLHKDAAHSLNVRGAFLHMVGDLLTSVAVLANGVILYFFQGWGWLDPALSLLIVAFIWKSAWPIFKQAVAVLMNATPAGLDLNSVSKTLTGISEVKAVHYLHAWNAAPGSIAFSCHVVVDDQMVSRTETVAEKMRHQLWHRFRIDHPVLQFESAACGNGGLLCELSCNGETAPATTDTNKDGHKPAAGVSRTQSYVYTGLRLVLGVVFLYASYDKILHPQAFAQAVFNYQILPDAAVNLAALVLPWLELFLGLCLVAGLWLPGATVTSTGLLAVFIGALVFNQIRGLDIHCGCFSTETTAGTADF